MIVKIDKLSHDFRGITKVNDKVTFVEKTLPTETVDIRITKEKKNYNEAKVVSYIDKSSDRDNYPCPFYDRCGACDIGYIEYDKGIESKKRNFMDIMKRYANIDINPDIVSLDRFGYRNKITLRVDKSGKISLLESKTNNKVNINNCLIVNDKINSIIKILSNINLNGIDKVTIRGEEEIMVILDGNIDKDYIINILNDKVSSIILNNDVIYGSEHIKIKANNFEYAIYPLSFFQVNTKMMIKLYDRVKEYSGRGNRLLDLYCGAGTIGIYLSDNFKYIDGFEINSDAIRGANLNKEINNISNANFICKSASDIIIKDYDVVVVDPPRSGLDNNTLNNLLNSGTNKIVYVSCSPITLARDINILKSNYDVKKITLFDMFPNTKHIESVCLLKLKENNNGNI